MTTAQHDAGDRPGRLTYANVASTLALVLALGGGGAAVAAGLAKNSVGSPQIKNGGVKQVDLARGAVGSQQLRDGSVQLADLSAAARAALSESWDPSSTLVSGRTITGSTYYVITASSTGQALNQTISFPARAPEALSGASFAPDSSAASTDDDPACTGTYNEPTAPAGYLCGYLASSSGFSSVSLSALHPGQDKGFVMRGVTSAGGSVSVDFSWAYTAP